MSWDWPQRTSSYLLEAEGYVALQRSVRYSEHPPVSITTDRDMRLLHLRGRMIRRHGEIAALMSPGSLEHLRKIKPGEVIKLPVFHPHRT